MSDVASLSVGLNLNSAHFKSQLIDSFNVAKQQSKQYTTFATEEAKKTSKSFELINKQLHTSLKSMALLAGAGFSFSSIIATTRKYSQALTDLSSVTGITGKQLDLLDSKALKLSRDSQFSANQIIDAYRNIASINPHLLKTNVALEEFTQESIILAQATGSTLPDAVDVLNLSLKQFNATTSDSERFINVLAASVKSGTSDFNDTASAIKSCGIVASQANISFEQLNATIQLLSEKGIKGQNAGKALRNIFLKLEKGTNSSLKPSVVGLEKALDNLSSKNLSTAQAVKLFGAANINAATTLVQSRNRISSLTQQLTGTNTAYEQSSKRVNNLNGDLNQLANSFEGFVIKIGQSGTGPLRTGVQSLTSAVGYLANNLNQIVSIGMHSLIPIFGIKMMSSLRSNVSQWYAQEKAIRVAAKAQVETAKTTIASAQATINESQAHARLLASRQAILKQHGVNVSYQREYAALSRTIKEAKILEAQATNQLAEANSRLAIRSKLAASAGRVLKSVYSLIGGPLGAAMLAGSAIAYFAEQANAAHTEATTLARSVKELLKEYEKLSDRKLNIRQLELEQEIDNQKKAIYKQELVVTNSMQTPESLNKNNASWGSYWVTGANELEIERSQDELDTMNEKLKQQKEELQGILDLRQRIRDGSHTPSNNNSNEGEGNGDNGGKPIWSGRDAKVTVSKYKDLLSELEIANANSLDKINLQEQQAKEKLIQAAKEAGVTNEQLQKDLALVTEKYAKERLNIAEKYSPAASIVRQTYETNKELEALYQQGLISYELYKAKMVDPSNEIRAEVDPDFKAQQEFDLKIATLNEYLLQEKALLDQARSENELSEESYQQRLLELHKKYSDLKLKAEEDNNLKMRQSISVGFVASKDLFGSMADLVGTFSSKSGSAYKALFAISKGFAIADAILNLNSAIMKAMNDPTATTTAAKIANMATVASAGAQVLSTIQSATMTGMAHDGIDYVPKEGTWLLQKGERVIDSRTNADLKNFLGTSNKSGGNINVNVPVNVGGGDISEEDGKEVGRMIKESVLSIIDEQMRPGGKLNHR